MEDSDRPSLKDEKWEKVLDLIRKIAERSGSTEYYFRGEPQINPKVSSSLYRVFEKEIEARLFDVEAVQKDILNKARQFTSGTDHEILTELQHFGGKTNLVDFTTDFNIALFFSCDGFYDEDGRIIFYEVEKTNGQAMHPQIPQNRVIAQKSVFVRPLKGFIEPDVVIRVPKNLKLAVLTFLRKSHGISTESIYNDLHGFIRYQEIHQMAYTEFYQGLEYFKKGNHDKAICHYNKAIEFNPHDPHTYNNRGFAYYKNCDIAKAISDFDMAIELSPGYSKAYVNRSVAFLRLEKWDRARSDLWTVRGFEVDVNALFCNIYESVTDLEQTLGVNLPKDIREMLSPAQE